MSSVNEQFGAAIARRREALGWSQKRFADELSQRLGKTINQPTITRLEAGTRPTPLNEVYEIANVLGVHVTDLLPGGRGIDGLLADVQFVARKRETQVQERIRDWIEQNKAFREAVDALEATGQLVAMQDGKLEPDLETITEAIRGMLSTIGLGGEKALVHRIVLAMGVSDKIENEVDDLVLQEQGLWENNDLTPFFPAIYQGEPAEHLAKAIFEKLDAEYGDAES